MDQRWDGGNKGEALHTEWAERMKELDTWAAEKHGAGREGGSSVTTRGRESRKDASPPGVSEKGGEGEWKRERRGVTGGQRESREGEERGRNTDGGPAERVQRPSISRGTVYRMGQDRCEGGNRNSRRAEGKKSDR